MHVRHVFLLKIVRAQAWHNALLSVASGTILHYPCGTDAGAEKKVSLQNPVHS